MEHDAWHQLLELIAALVLLGGGALLLARDVGRPARVPVAGSREVAAQPDLATIGALLLIALSCGAAAIHLAAAPAHFEELGSLGMGFLVAAVLQGGWAAAFAMDRRRAVAAAGLLINAVLVLAWAWTRVVGLSVEGLPPSPEAVGVPDGITVVFEVALLVALAPMVLGLGRPRIHGGVRARTLAVIALVPAVGVIFLATTLAAGLALDEGHGGTSGHHGETPAATNVVYRSSTDAGSPAAPRTMLHRVDHREP